MTNEELEQAKESLRLALVNPAFTITKEELSRFIDYQTSFWRGWNITDEDKKALVTYLENYIFVEHDHNGYAIIGAEPFDNTWYTRNKPEPKDEYFWNLYRLHHAQKGDLDKTSLDKLDKVTLPNLMNCLGNPKDNLNKQRKRYGLVLGDVQSGKTSTYSGLICKAADAGIKVVILLAGTTETLRQQTQERIEEDIVGLTIRTDYFHNTQSSRVGVGLLNGWSNKVTTYTLYDDDFNTSRAQNMSAIGSQNSLVLFVVKKNVPVLTHLHEWLTGQNQHLNADGKLPYSLLLIDDEADNASINTRDSNVNPTATNKKIREICESFMDSNYVGFTATPFANIFINPSSDEDMVAADLFPKDFIYVLPTPAPYIGAQRIFGSPTPEHPNYGDCSYMLRYITDISEPTTAQIRLMSDTQITNGPIFFTHKKSWRGKLPKSLIESIRCFYLANAIRDLDPTQITAPRTMLVNISRFVGVHLYLKKEIEQIVDKDFKEIRINFSTEQIRNEGNELYRELQRLFEKYYNNCGYSWKEVGAKENLLRYDRPPKVIVVNSSKESHEETPNYKVNPSLRIIAVGGAALSRGLTLKGLSTSYFYRNSCTYDVLMQMGRWFGYRPHYDKVCRIWITNTSANWYREIADATEELKSELERMKEQGSTPADFGLRIRRDDTALEITARNKMRAARQCEVRTLFWGDVFETPYFSTKPQDNIHNVDNSKSWLQRLVNNGAQFEKVTGRSSYILRDIPITEIAIFLNCIRTSEKNLRFDRTKIIDFIKSNEETLSTWDVIVVGGNGPEIKDFLPINMSLCAIQRRLSITGDEDGFSFTQHGVIGGNNDGSIGLNNAKQVNEEYQRLENTCKISRETWFKYAKRNPAFFIYPVKATDVDKVEPVLADYLREIGESPIIGYAVGIPGCGHESDNDTRSYYTNVVYQQNTELYESEEDE